MNEPELITIVEGPTPDFRPTPQLWMHSIYEGPSDVDVVMCELRTMKGEGIVARCRTAWDEGRPVKLDYPDHMRTRQQIDVVAMRLHEVQEGPMLTLWVRYPFDEEEEIEEEYDEGDDDFIF